MDRKRVAVLTNKTLLMAGVGRMLTEQSGLEVSTISTDDEELMSKLSAFKPKVVVLDSEDALLASRIPLEELLQRNPSPTVVALNLAQDDIRAFKHKRILRGSARDLLRIVSRGGSRRRQAPNKEVPP